MIDRELLNQLTYEIAWRVARLEEQESLSNSAASPLYHYTTAEGFMGILESKELWATNILFLNDTSELVDAIKLFTSELETNPLKLGERTGWLQTLILPNLETAPVDHFVVSFCEHGDLLSQWRAYGARGSGYSLGFEPSALTRNPLGGHLPSNRLLRKVIYDLPTKRALIQARLDILREVLEPRAAELEADGDNEIRVLLTLFAQVALTLNPDRALMKNPAFREEGEWRLLQSLKFPRRENVTDIRVRAINGSLAPFVRLPWMPLELGRPSLVQREAPPSKSGSLKRVYCGPTAHPVLKHKAAEQLPAGAGWKETEVMDSVVPLRQ